MIYFSIDIKNTVIHFLTVTLTNWFLFMQYLSYNLLFLSNMIAVPFAKQFKIQYSKKMMDCNNKCFWHSMRFHMFFIFFLAIYFSRSSQSSSCYQQRQQLLQWPLQCHVECAQLFWNHRISNLLQEGYSKYHLQQKI